MNWLTGQWEGPTFSTEVNRILQWGDNTPIQGKGAPYDGDPVS